MSWYKVARQQGGTTSLMDDYSEGKIPSSSDHKKDPRSLVNAVPEFGGNKRPGYPTGVSANPDTEETSEAEKIHEQIPGEAVLMDDGGDSHDGLGDRFVSDNEKLPIGADSESVRLDKGVTGPNNMQNNTQKGNIFNKIKQKTKVKGVRL
jgi:hypothetical protein